MMQHMGCLKALQHQVQDPISYFLRVDHHVIPMNQVIGENIRIRFKGEIYCIHCGRRMKKGYRSGSCFKCFRDLPENDLCMVKPELCHYDQGTCRDHIFGETHCMQPHYVYLALSSDVKVGITRKGSAFKRWVDQGAVAALPIAEVPTRKDAGFLEVHLSQFLSDKTNWRRMLKNEIVDRDLWEVREELKEKIPVSFQPWLLKEPKLYRFTYPQTMVPSKITSLNLDKQSEVTGQLMGIKGQYLILDTGVLNVRKFSGYNVLLELNGG